MCSSLFNRFLPSWLQTKQSIKPSSPSRKNKEMLRQVSKKSFLFINSKKGDLILATAGAIILAFGLLIYFQVIPSTPLVGYILDGIGGLLITAATADFVRRVCSNPSYNRKNRKRNRGAKVGGWHTIGD